MPRTTGDNAASLEDAERAQGRWEQKAQDEVARYDKHLCQETTEHGGELGTILEDGGMLADQLPPPNEPAPPQPPDKGPIMPPDNEMPDSADDSDASMSSTGKRRTEEAGPSASGSSKSRRRGKGKGVTFSTNQSQRGSV